MKPKLYEAMVEALEDYALYFEAEKRIRNAEEEEEEYISFDQVMTNLGIEESDLDGIEVEID